MKNSFLAFLLCILGITTPFAGLHRFYLGKNISGVFYLLTWGFFGIGTIIDLFRIGSMTDDYNFHFLLRHELGHRYLEKRRDFNSPERAILKCARKHGGSITIPMVTMETGLPLIDAKRCLQNMYQEEFCLKDVDEDGEVVFTFKGLETKGPLL